MKLALNGATTLLGTMEDDIAAATAAGYEGLEVWLPKLNAYLERATLADLRSALEASGLWPLTLNSLERFNLNDPSGHQRMLVDAERLCRLAAALGVRTVVVVPSPQPAGLTREAVMERSAADLADLLRLAERYNLRLGLEFLGFDGCSVRTLGDALSLIRRVGHPRLGVVVDTFHFYVGGSDPCDLESVRPGELEILHINDCEPGERSGLTDDRRLYPGLGVIPLREILTAARRGGYDGYVAVEIFRPEYWRLPPAEVAAQALLHTRQVLAGQ